MAVQRLTTENEAEAAPIGAVIRRLVDVLDPTVTALVAGADSRTIEQ